MIYITSETPCFAWFPILTSQGNWVFWNQYYLHWNSLVGFWIENDRERVWRLMLSKA